MLLHSIIALLHTVPGKILIFGTIGMDAVLSFLAVAEPVSNRAVIIVAICGNVTMLVGIVFTGWIQLKSARISSANREMLIPLVELPDKVSKLAEGIDGVAHELKAATKEGNIAKVDAALAQGQLKEREAEIARQGASAVARETAPASVIVENHPDKPANVKQAK